MFVFSVVQLIFIFEINKINIVNTSNSTLMFVQKYRYQLPPRRAVTLDPPPSPLKNQEVKKRIGIKQLKGHQNKLNYSNPQKFLIQNIQKAISSNPKIHKQPNLSLKSYSDKNESTISYAQSSLNKRYDFTKREERIIAARKFREKKLKVSDISQILKAQQEMISSRTSHNPEHVSRQKVPRYKDLLKQCGDQSLSTQQRKLKSCWFALALKGNQQATNMDQKTLKSQLDVATIGFLQSDRPGRNRMKILINREKRKEMVRRTSYISYTARSKRPNTTTPNTINPNEDNFIEPW